MDYSIQKYNSLCAAIAKSEFTTITVAELIKNLPTLSLTENKIVLRHDVDRQVYTALAQAQVEHKHGLRASYYFRMPASWNEKVIKQISDLGHEVGLHYECLDKAKGDIVRASQIMRDELALLRKIADVKTVSMHGNPLTKFDNRDFWKHVDFKDFALLGEVYLSCDFQKVMYYSDTGRTWLDGKYNLKDVIPEGFEKLEDKPVIQTTDDLVALIGKEKRNLYLLIHPERWPVTKLAYCRQFCQDIVFNVIKVIISRLTRK